MGFCSNPAISEGTMQSMVCSSVLAPHFEHILKSSLILSIVPIHAGALHGTDNPANQKSDENGVHGA